ncbi:hypothetical protein [Lentzea sp. HUAS12]|uniref:hypothetical protein n=1 Tax=Lentzea sp. HUAS12 TaxID=2951806 RepID=UPI00209DF165|nr:hypothetical protein [Lentzea sp. HUAS12]USX54111.1 hypothetical protein ND450_08430 [Lentzea sp. HUAS12]
MDSPTGPNDRDDGWQAQAVGVDYPNQHRPGGPEPYTEQWLHQRNHDAQAAVHQAWSNAIAAQMAARPVPPPQPHDPGTPSEPPSPNPWSPFDPADVHSDSPYAALSSPAPPAGSYRSVPRGSGSQVVRRLAGWIPAVVVLAVVGAAGVWLSDLHWPDPDRREELKDSATSFCRQMAAERLGTPADAELGHSSVTASDVDEYFDYFVVATVQWSAGADTPARKDFECRVRYNRDTNGWTLHRIDGS